MRQQKTRLQHSKSLLEEIGRKEDELQGIADRLLSATPESIESRVGEIRSFVRSDLNDLRDLLRRDTALARAELLKHPGEITMTRHRGPVRCFYVAEGKWDLLGSDWTAGATASRGGFGWLRGPDTYRIEFLNIPFRSELVHYTV
jgi:hypothetical protein